MNAAFIGLLTLQVLLYHGLSTYTGFTAFVTNVNSAITKVSTERSKLGAYPKPFGTYHF